MPCSVRYGVDSELQLPLDSEQLHPGSTWELGPAHDVRRATELALTAPVAFPRLAQAVVPGDHVTIAVDRFVPQAETVVAVLIEQLQECGIENHQIAVVFPEGRRPAPLPVRLPATVPPSAKSGSAVRVEVHNPADRGHLCFLANTRAGRPIYLNRLIGDAELVIMVGVARGAASWSYRGPYGGLYPTFSDLDTQKRYRNPHLLNVESETFVKSQQEIDAVGWQLGAQILVEVIPGRGDEAASVTVGEVAAVERITGVVNGERHRLRVDQPAQVVVAALTGREAQTWERLASALATVSATVDDGGAVVLCTDLAEPPGPALELLAQCGDDRDEILQQICRDRPIDLFVALTLAEVQRRVRVYLLSKLDATVVEDLGITPIAEPDDVGRLAKRRGSCLVVADAQWATVDVGASS